MARSEGDVGLSSDVLRERLSGQQWTSHNVRLNNEITTLPGQPDFFETDLRLHAIQRVLRMFYGNDFSRLSVADLGCLEGGFATALCLQGATVLAIEARATNIEKVELLKQHFELSGMTVRRGDVKDFTIDRHGAFDVVLALGILYHLDQPVEWLHQVAAATKDVLIVDTHFAPADEESLKQIDSRLAALSPLEQVDFKALAYEGRWFTEYDEHHDREAQLWASYSNLRSFWLTKESLLLALKHAGFSLVCEQHDYSIDSYKYFTCTFPRGMFVAIKNE